MKLHRQERFKTILCEEQAYKLSDRYLKMVIYPKNM